MSLRSAVVSVAALAVAIGFGPQSRAENYRLTVRLNIAGNLISESVVRKESTSPLLLTFDQGPGTRFRISGDSIRFDLGSKILLVTLAASHSRLGDGSLALCLDDNFSVGASGCRRSGYWTARIALHRAQPETGSGRYSLSARELPALLLLGKGQDLRSGQIVDFDELPRVLGTQIRLQNAWVENSSAPVTRGLGADLNTALKGAQNVSCVFNTNGVALTPSEEIVDPRLGQCISAAIITR